MAYKIFLNLDAVDMNVLCGVLKGVGSAMFSNNCFYVWPDQPCEKSHIIELLNGVGVVEIYCEEITESSIKRETGHAYAWLMEHYRKSVVEKFEQEHQDELRQMLDNIEKANQFLTEEIINKLKEEQSNARRKNGKAKKGKTSQDSD